YVRIIICSSRARANDSTGIVPLRHLRVYLGIGRAQREAYLAALHLTRSGNDRLRTRVQGLSWAACGVAQALLPVSSAWKASALVTGKSACATTPPIRAPAFDGHGKAAPD